VSVSADERGSLLQPAKGGDAARHAEQAPRVRLTSEHAYQWALSGALFSLGFFVLFSSAGTSLSLGMLLLLCLVSVRRLWRMAAWREPVLGLGLILFAYIAVRTVIDEGLRLATLSAVNRYHELVMIPLLWTLMRAARRPQAFANGLMVGAVVFAFTHWLAPLVPQLAEFLFSRRVSAGFGLAICAFLFFEHARLGRLPPFLGYSAAVLLAAPVIFASDGRTGHVVLMALLICAAFRAAPRRVRLSVVLAIAVAGLLVASASNPLRLRAMVPGHPARQTVNNPHNEYLLQLGAGGLPALLLYILWLGAPIWNAMREHRVQRPWAGAVGCVALAFALASLFNSVLLDFVEGHFYGALLAWLLVRRVED
jgi:hypothetical protein